MLIRDPVHGDIELGRLETAVLDLPAMQRLRGIKQLGTAHLVYPGCVHTRFDHSLGAARMCHAIVAALRRNGASVHPDEEALVGAAALLHDVTHVPFGHTLEDERRLFPRHDKGSRLGRFLDGELGSSLEKLGVKAELAGLLGAGPARLPLWAGDVVSSTIDADLLDYLRRDAYFAGLAQRYDDRVLTSFLVADGRLALQMAKHGMERPDARSEIVQLLRMRYFLTERVYYHHTKVAAGAMVSKAVELALEAGAMREADLLDLNDWTLLDRLERSGIPAVAGLCERLRRRNLLKRGYVLSARTVSRPERAALVTSYHEGAALRRQAEVELAAALGCAVGELVVYCPALTVMKEARALVRTADGVRHLNDTSGGSDAEIRALEERYEGLWRFYVFVPEERTARAAAAAAERFGFPSEHGAAP